LPFIFLYNLNKINYLKNISLKNGKYKRKYYQLNKAVNQN
jgi:hypothetical protein